MIPPIADAEDPTTQVAWPSRPSRNSDLPPDHASVSSTAIEQENVAQKANPKAVAAKNRLTTWQLITLTISMAGAQIAWTVELGYAHRVLLEFIQSLTSAL